jgi:hypothetical protein
MTKSLTLAVGLAMSLGFSTAVAQQRHDDHHKWGAVGQDVTLTSCITKGQDDGTFLLTQVADVPVHPATMGRVVYWLDSVKDIKGHVGKQVRINAKVTEVKQGEMEVKAGDDDKGGWYVEIEGPGRDVRTPASNVGESPAGRKDEAKDIKTTLVRLKVSEVVRVAENCPAR